MKTSFQDGVDAIYNAIVAQGTTPGGKSPADLVSSIAKISRPPGGSAGNAIFTGSATNNNYGGATMTVSTSWRSTTSYKKLMIFSVVGRFMWNTSGDTLTSTPSGSIERAPCNVSISGGGTISQHGTYHIAENVVSGTTITAAYSYPHPGLWQKPMIYMIIWEL